MLGVQLFNSAEAAFWFALAALAAALGHRTRGFTPGRQILLAVFLALFGVSDIWEVFTGSWWQPLPLLALKATCLGGLCMTAGLIYRSRWTRVPAGK
jgi:hypothetical protein